MCFICLTIYQLLLADIFARELYHQRKVKSLIIAKYFDVYDYKKNCDYADCIIIKKSLGNKLKSYFLLGTGLYPYYCALRLKKADYGMTYFNDRDPISKIIAKYVKRKKQLIVLMEEGFATYNAERNVKKIGASAGADCVVVGYPELYSKFNKGNYSLHELNYSSIFCQRNIELFMKQLGIGQIQDDVMGDESVIIFLGQSMKEDDLAGEQEIELVSRLIKERHNIKIFVKPHPRSEDRRRYEQIANEFPNVYLPDEVTERLPIEIFAYTMKASLIMSMWSSAGSTLANILPHAEFVFCYQLFGQIHEEIDMFAKYATNVKIPRRWGELIEIVDKHFVAEKVGEKTIATNINVENIDLSAFNNLEGNYSGSVVKTII